MPVTRRAFVVAQMGITPLISAVVEQRNEIVELLLKRGADPNLKTTVRRRADECRVVIVLTAPAPVREHLSSDRQVGAVVRH